jgi:hypothetical protein
VFERFFFFFVVLALELRALCLLRQRYTSSPKPFFVFNYLQERLLKKNQLHSPGNVKFNLQISQMYLHLFSRRAKLTLVVYSTDCREENISNGLKTIPGTLRNNSACSGKPVSEPDLVL